MGIVQKDAFKTTLISFVGLGLGYFNKAYFFIHFMTQEQVGLVNLILTVGLLFATLSNLGTVFAAWRFFPFFRNEERNHYGFLLLNVLFVLLGITLFTGILFLFKEPIVAKYSKESALFVNYYYWIIPIGVANVFFFLFESYMRGMFENVLPVFLQEFVLRVLVFLLLMGLGFDLISFDTFFIGHALVYFVPCSILLIYLIRKGELKFSLSSISVPARFRKILVYFSMISYFNTLTTMVVISLDAMMIFDALGLAATGIYTTVVYLSSALMVPYRAINRVASPLIAKYWKEKNLAGIQELYQKSSSVNLFIGLSLFGMVGLPIYELFSFIPKYAEGAPVFLALMVGKVFDMYGGINGTIFSTSKKFKYDILFTIILLSLVFLLNWWLIPIYGLIGAAISTSFAYTFYNTVRTVYVYRLFGLHPFTVNQIKVLGTFLIFVAFSYLLFNLPFWFTFNPLLLIIIKEIVVFSLFIFPVLFFNMEPEVVNYLKKWQQKIPFIKRFA
ncbi:MAG: hypothetical protein RL264_1200 [Bacteroidota bacterium]|jgi:O-antigen/teichoic acid export membrane protein